MDEEDETAQPVSSNMGKGPHGLPKGGAAQSYDRVQVSLLKC